MSDLLSEGHKRKWKAPWLSGPWFTAWARARQRTTARTASYVVEEIIDWLIDGPFVARNHPELNPEGNMRKTWCLELRTDSLDPKFNETVEGLFLDVAGKLNATVNLGVNNEERMLVDMKCWSEDTIYGIVDIKKRWEEQQAARANAAPRGGSNDQPTDDDFAALHADDDKSSLPQDVIDTLRGE